MAGAYSPQVVQELSYMVAQNLHLWGLSPRSRITLLNLSENATYDLYDPDDGRDLILRVQREGYSSLNEIKSELSWIDALRTEQVISTADVIPSVSGSSVVTLASDHGVNRLGVAFSKLGGHEPQADLELPYWFETIGAITSKMHEQSRRWHHPDWFVRKVWDFDHIIGKDAYWGQWSDSKTINDEERSIIAKTAAVLCEIMQSYGINARNFGVIHADLRTANLLVDEDILHVLDFDDMGYGWYLFDFASSLSFFEDNAAAPALMQSWIKGYCRHGDISDEEIKLLPAFSIMRRIEILAWVNSHREIPFAKSVLPTFGSVTASLCKDFLDGTYLKM